jgi:hypothetical protein
LNQSDRCRARAHCHALIAPLDPCLRLTVGLHIGRVRRGLERSREQQIGRTSVRRPPSDPRVSPTLPRVTLCAPRQTPHLRNSALNLSDASFQLGSTLKVRRLSKTTPRGSRAVGPSPNPGRRTQACPMVSHERSQVATSAAQLGLVVGPEEQPVQRSEKQGSMPLTSLFLSANTSSLLKCANHQVYHHVHVC